MSEDLSYSVYVEGYRSDAFVIMIAGLLSPGFYKTDYTGSTSYYRLSSTAYAYPDEDAVREDSSTDAPVRVAPLESDCWRPGNPNSKDVAQYT